MPKDLIFGELADGHRSTGYPLLMFKDGCKRDMNFLDVCTDTSEGLAAECARWRGSIVTTSVAGMNVQRIFIWTIRLIRKITTLG